MTEAVRRRPYQVVLFDEVEKAHPEVFNIFLQIFDDGRLTDSKGRTVDFKNTIIIMTSNIGSHFLLESDVAQDEKESQVRAALHAHFKPEFLNRLDDTIFFNPIDQDTLRKIVEGQLKLLVGRAKAQGMQIKVEKKVLDWLAERGYDPQFGARPLKRLVQREVGNLLSREILKGDFDGETTWTLSMSATGDGLALKK